MIKAAETALLGFVTLIFQEEWEHEREICLMVFVVY